jgi:hypothetical protein
MGRKSIGFSRRLKGALATADWAAFHLLKYFGAIPVNLAHNFYSFCSDVS